MGRRKKDKSIGIKSFAVEGGSFYYHNGIGKLVSCDKTVTKVDIPEFVDGTCIIVIGEEAFKDCTQLKTVILPECLVEIGNSAFEGCTELKSVTARGTVEMIGKNAFKGYLKDVDTVRFIEESDTELLIGYPMHHKLLTKYKRIEGTDEFRVAYYDAVGDNDFDESDDCAYVTTRTFSESEVVFDILNFKEDHYNHLIIEKIKSKPTTAKTPKSSSDS